MFKKALVSAALIALVSSTASASELTEFASELHGAKARITSIVSGTAIVDDAHAGTPDGSGEGTPPSGDDVDFNDWVVEDDALAQPLYFSSANRLGNAGDKLISSDILERQFKFAEAVIKKTEACADINIALVDLGVANHHAAAPGFSMKLKAFGPELKDLFDVIKARRGVICQ